MENTEEFNKEKAKTNRITQFEAFKSSVSSIGVENSIKSVMQILKELFERIESNKINNKKPTEFEIYKSVKQELKKYYKENKAINESKMRLSIKIGM